MTINSDGQKVTDPGELAALNAGKTVAAYHDAQQGDNYINKKRLQRYIKKQIFYAR